MNNFEICDEFKLCLEDKFKILQKYEDVKSLDINDKFIEKLDFNQLLYQNSGLDPKIKFDYLDIKRFLDNFTAKELITVSTALHPKYPLFLDNKFIGIKEIIIKKFKTEVIEDKNLAIDSIIDEVNREIVCDLMRCGVEEENIKKSENRMFEEIGHKPNWVVVSLQYFGEKLYSNLFKPFENLNYYVSAVLKEDEILLGYKGSYFEAGYSYMPHIPFMCPPNLEFPDFCPRWCFMTRCGKYLHNKNYYIKTKL